MLALALTTDAAAGISVDAVSPHSVRAGEPLRTRISAGLRLWEKIPLYLVPSAQALRPMPCDSGRGFCEPKVSGPPTGNGYHRVATVSFRKTKSRLLSFEVPRLAPGRYEVAF